MKSLVAKSLHASNALTDIRDRYARSTRLVVYGEIAQSHPISEKLDSILAARRIDNTDRQPLMNYLCAIHDIPEIRLAGLTRSETWEVRAQLMAFGDNAPRPCATTKDGKFRPLSQIETITLVEFALLGLRAT